MQIRNTSHSRTIVHNENNQTYRVDPGMVAELPDDVAASVLQGWQIASMNVGGTVETLPSKPWEQNTGALWERLKVEFPHIGRQQKETVGPDRPEVIEPAQPVDAYDGSGKLIESKANVHACPEDGCGKKFTLLRACRSHQTKMHKH